jgi:3-hydroxybutyrate dehydrogenase
MIAPVTIAGLAGKGAIVTGSTSGIGLGIATQLAEAGVNIMLNGFGDAAAIETTRAALASKTGVKVLYHGADVTKRDQIAAMVTTMHKDCGVDILVNNAGIQFVAPIESFPNEKWDAVLATNLSAAFYGTAQVLPMMRQKGFGRIINIASAHGLVASPHKSAYVAAKHGMVGLTKVTALETAGQGITCNAICPGWVLTPLVQKQIDAIAAEKKLDNAAATIELLREKQPSLQFVKPEDIGSMVLFLCSDAAAQITGTALPIDGGWTAR